MPDFGEPLSDREREVLQCLSKGAGNKDIAAELFISENTVKVHLRNIYTKLGVSSRTEAATIGLQQGMIVMPGVDTAVSPPTTPETEEAETALDERSPSETAAAEERRPWLNRRTGTILLGGLLLVVVLITGLTMAQSGLFPATRTPAFTPQELGEYWQTARPLAEPLADGALAANGLNIYLIGGETAAGLQETTLVYHTTAHTWEEVAPKPTAVTDATAAELFGIIYVPGGRLADGQPTAVVEAYSPSNDAWSVVQSLPQPIAGGLALSDGSQLYLFGGTDGTRYLDTAYVYDPVTNIWRPLPPMSQARAHLAGGVIMGQLYAVGGEDGETALALCEYFDPATEVWADCPDMLLPRANAGGASVVNKLFVLGGNNDGEPVTYSELFDPTNNRWNIVNTPVLAGGAWTDLGVTNVETRIFAVGGRQNEQMLADNYLFAPPVYQLFLPAAPRE